MRLRNLLCVSALILALLGCSDSNNHPTQTTQVILKHDHSQEIHCPCNDRGFNHKYEPCDTTARHGHGPAHDRGHNHEKCCECDD